LRKNRDTRPGGTTERKKISRNAHRTVDGAGEHKVTGKFRHMQGAKIVTRRKMKAAPIKGGE